VTARPAAFSDTVIVARFEGSNPPFSTELASTKFEVSSA